MAKRTERVGRTYPGGLPPLSILIVEDHADCADSLAMLLRAYGHDVFIARTGYQGLKAAEENPPDVILLDLGLPDLNGYDVAKHLNEWRNKKAQLLIAVSGYGMETDRHRSAESGVDLHLLKPVDPQHLEGVLRDFQKGLFDQTPNTSGRRGIDNVSSN